MLLYPREGETTQSGQLTEDRWRGYRDAGRRELVAGVDDTHGRGDDTVRSHAHASIRDQALMHATDLEEISPYDG